MRRWGRLAVGCTAAALLAMGGGSGASGSGGGGCGPAAGTSIAVRALIRIKNRERSPNSGISDRAVWSASGLPV